MEEVTFELGFASQGRFACGEMRSELCEQRGKRKIQTDRPGVGHLGWLGAAESGFLLTLVL